nr:hypothetical protein [Tanacetum cinerariifolium]
TIPASDGILADALTIPAGSTPIPSSEGLSAQRQQELDAAQLIYNEADWLELMAKIATNSALSKQLLGDDVNEDNMNERLGRTMKQVKALSIAQLKNKFEYTHRTLERSNLLNFKRTTFRPTPSLEAPFAMRAQQGIPQDVPAASSQVPAGVSTAPSTTSEHMSTEHTVDESITLSSRTRRKHIAKKRVTPIVDVADDALIKFDSASDSDGDPFPYAPFAGWEMVPSPLGFIHAYYDMDEHTKHFTSLRELLHMVEKNDLRKLLGVVDNFYQKEEPDTFALIFWRLYPRAQVHVLETVDGRVIYMFVDVSFPLSAVTLKRMLKHGLEVLKLLVGGDLTMAEQLVSFIKAALLTAQPAI